LQQQQQQQQQQQDPSDSSTTSSSSTTSISSTTNSNSSEQQHDLTTAPPLLSPPLFQLVRQGALDPIKVSQLAEMFNNQLDIDGNGTIEVEEIGIALENMKYTNIKAAEILERFVLMDSGE
jgi:hypothetical protein